MTKQEFQKRLACGEELVILDDLVLNVAELKYNHPGGKFMIEHNIGRDISKFFYGGYSLAHETISPHTHSNIARTYVNDLVIARFVEEALSIKAEI
jgi:cytochrome b involved in lipid metabolism